VKLSQGKSNCGTVFNTLFGEKSLGVAMDLINDALKHESDDAVKIELKRRLKLIDPKQINLVKCGRCKKTFQPRKIRKHKQNFCNDCIKANFGKNSSKC
jgi:hypothetical protein